MPPDEPVKLIGMNFSIRSAASVDPETNTKDQRKEKGPEPDDLPSKLNHFATRLQLLQTYVGEIGRIARTTSFTNMASLLVLMEDISTAEKQRMDTGPPLAHCTFEVRFETESGKKTRGTRTCAIFDPRHLETVIDHGKYHDAALRILHETAVQHLVNSYEHLLGELLSFKLWTNNDLATKDQTITYRELLEIGDLVEAKRLVVEKQVLDFARNNDAKEQLKFFADKLNVDVSSHFPRDLMAQYFELVLRRHAVVHAGGRATPEFVRQRSRIKNLGGSCPEAGSILELSRKYINNSWNIVYSLGVISGHLFARSESHRNSDGELESAADSELLAASFWAIKNRHYQAAETILNYAHNLRLSTDSNMLTILINLAQVYKWKNEPEKCKQVLAKRDWRSTNKLFQLCAAVLNDETDCEHLLRSAARDEGLAIEDLYDWPVFQRFREVESFQRMVTSVYGEINNDSHRALPLTLLNTDHSKTLKWLEENLIDNQDNQQNKADDE